VKNSCEIFLIIECDLFRKREKMIWIGFGLLLGLSYSNAECWNRMDQGKYNLVDNQKSCIQRENIPKDAIWL
jgi:hypothetical protein